MKIAFFEAGVLEYAGGFEKYFIETAISISKKETASIDIITLDNRFSEKLNFVLSFYYNIKNKRNYTSIFKESNKSIQSRLGKVNYIKVSSFKQLKIQLKKYDVIYSKNEILEAAIFKLFIGYNKIPPVVFCCATPLYYPNAKSVQAKLRDFIYRGFVYKFLAGKVVAFHVKNVTDEMIIKNKFPNSNVYKVHNSLDVKVLRQNANEFIYQQKFNKKLFNIIWVGRLVEQKGLNRLTRIIDTVNSNHDIKQKIAWHIIGDGEEKEMIDHISKKWTNVFLHGHIDYIYMANVYKTSNLLISTSNWESFGYTIIEANVHDVPAIAFNIPGPNEIIKNGLNGYIVNSEEEFVNKVFEFTLGVHKITNISDYIKENFDESKHTEMIYSILNNAKK